MKKWIQKRWIGQVKQQNKGTPLSELIIPAKKQFLYLLGLKGDFDALSEWLMHLKQCYGIEKSRYVRRSSVGNNKQLKICRLSSNSLFQDKSFLRNKCTILMNQGYFGNIFQPELRHLRVKCLVRVKNQVRSWLRSCRVATQ